MDASAADGDDRYACKHCRRVLFTAADLMDHVPEQHAIAARRKLKDAKTKGLNSSHIFLDGCSSWFLVDPLEWMNEDDMAEGKLHCPNPKCHVRLGAFSWSGSQCSCGTWVTPSIKLTKSRVDRILTANIIPIVSTMMNDAAEQQPPPHEEEPQSNDGETSTVEASE